MKNGQDNWVDTVKDAASGYGTVILAVVCFIVLLAVIMAVVRLAVGLGASV